jgi:hypothetical protein
MCCRKKLGVYVSMSIAGGAFTAEAQRAQRKRRGLSLEGRDL